MRTLLLATGVALTMMFAASNNAQADGFRNRGFSLSIGTFGQPYGYGYGGYGYGGYHGGYGIPHYGYGHGHGHGHSVWHDTSHYDYHPPQAYRHGNHYHVQPGHYDWHRTGHWDVYHH